jgi:hypothetical protein
MRKTTKLQRIADSPGMVWTLVKWNAIELNLQSCHVWLSRIKIRTLLQKMKTFTIMVVCFWNYDVTPVCTDMFLKYVVSKDSFSTSVMKLLSGQSPLLQCECENSVQRQTKMVQLTRAYSSPVTYLVWNIQWMNIMYWFCNLLFNILWDTPIVITTHIFRTV